MEATEPGDLNELYSVRSLRASPVGPAKGYMGVLEGPGGDASSSVVPPHRADHLRVERIERGVNLACAPEVPVKRRF